MGVRFPSVASTTFVGPLPATAAETVVCTSPPFTPPLDAAQIFIHWFFALSAGAGTTSYSIRIRRGTTTGGIQLNANQWALAATPAIADFMSGCYIDNPGAVSGLQYSLTVMQAGATGAGTQPDVCLLVYSL